MKFIIVSMKSVSFSMKSPIFCANGGVVEVGEFHLDRGVAAGACRRHEVWAPEIVARCTQTGSGRGARAAAPHAAGAVQARPARGAAAGTWAAVAERPCERRAGRLRCPLLLLGRRFVVIHSQRQWAGKQRASAAAVAVRSHEYRARAERFRGSIEPAVGPRALVGHIERVGAVHICTAERRRPRVRLAGETLQSRHCRQQRQPRRHRH